MAGDSPFKVVIVGGGVVGLTLANMLEEFDIDYVVLEAYGSIAPAVGASIGLFPNGLRILDQIGCYERVQALPQQLIETSHTRVSSGKSLFCIKDISKHLEKRHGYPVLFFDRQWLLQLLYDNLQNKDNVVTNKRVVKIEHIEKGVEVTTSDGGVVRGTLVIGGDGVHSAVREQMTLIGNKLQPGYFPPGEPDRVPCYYKCSFGIAQGVHDYVTGELNNIRARGWSGLTISGPENRVYWFIFQRLPEPRYGKDIPKYTKEDELQFAKDFWDVPITDKISFGQIYSKKSSSTLTALHEVVYEKWFFKRIMLLGDSAHKPNPISGQGGNGAIESAAEFVNAIMRMKKTRSNGLNDMTDKEIEHIFEQTQSARHERAKLAVADAHRQQALSAYENPFLSTLTWEMMGPFAGDELVLSILSDMILGSARLDQVPIPSRSKVVPFNDELPAKPLSNAAKVAVRSSFAVGMASLVWLAGKSLRLPLGDLGRWNGVADISRPWGKSKKDLLVKLVSFFSYPLEGQSAAPRVHLLYFLTQLASPLLIYTIDGYRKGNQGTLLSPASIFLGAMQLKGIAYIAPLHALAQFFQNSNSPTGRFVSPEVGEALVPALTLGYAIPTALMLAQGTDITARQDLTAIWQFSPVIFSTLTGLFSAGRRWWRRRRGQSKADEAKERFAHYRTEDMSSLKTTYTCSIALQAASHIAVLTYCSLNSSISIADMFFGVPSPLSNAWNLPNVASQAAVFLKYDLGIASCAWAASGLYSIWDLRRLGYIRTQDAIKAALAAVVGQFVIGPGATWTGLTFWRDTVLAGARSS